MIANRQDAKSAKKDKFLVGCHLDFLGVLCVLAVQDN
jgi:hypothetical protein